MDQQAGGHILRQNRLKTNSPWKKYRSLTQSTRVYFRNWKLVYFSVKCCYF